MNAKQPKLIILFSGKRKSGKDFLAAALLAKLTDQVAQIIRISEPIKKHWAKKMDLSVNDLLGPLKEEHRKQMIVWSDKVRTQLPTFFCLEAFKSASKPIVIVSDVRRRTDMDYFTSLNIPLLAVRINASDEERIERGWEFTEGVDDVASECDLDDSDEWDFVINNNSESDAEIIFQNISAYVENALNT